MGWRGTLLLALALLTAGLLLYREFAAERRDLTWEAVIEGPRTLPPGEQITHLLSFDPATVTAIRLQRDGREWRVERSDEGWRGVEHPGEVDDFLADLLALGEIMPLDVPPERLGEHGLDPPEGVVELQRRGAAPVILLLGRRNPPSTGVYAQLGPGGRVVLTGALALWEFDKAVRALSPTAGAS